MPAGRRKPGEVVALREVWWGRVWAAYPAVVVEDSPEQRRFHIPAGTRWKAAADAEGRLLRVPTRRWRLVDLPREGVRTLSFAWPEVPYAILAVWDEGAGQFAGWYVNLESPLWPSPVGFDYQDHLLDVRVAPDRSRWEWKDEEELAEAVRRGLFTEREAEGFRQAGREAVARIVERRPPFDRDWDDWRPDPAWPVPTLPEGWDRVEGPAR